MGAAGHCRHRAWMLIALAPALLQSQPIYRCGNTYGQTPCTDGIVIRADDSRSAAQKAQTDDATRNAARLAERMERERLAALRRAFAAPQRPAQGAPKSPAAAAGATAAAPRNTTPESTPRPKPRSGEADPFTALARSADTKKKPAATAPRD